MTGSLWPRLGGGLSIAVLLAASIGAPAVTLARSPGLTGDVRTVTNGGTINPTTGDSEAWNPPGDQATAGTDEFAGGSEDGDPYAANIIDRSLSHGSAHGASTNSGKKAKSNPAFVNGFEGLNFYEQRYARRGNQFSVEPPDQAMCAGNGYIVEAVNDVFNVFDTSGNSVLVDNTATNLVGGFPRDVHHAVDLNSFYGYAPAINRSTGVRGPFVTDPTCIYDSSTNRFFLVVLTLDTNPNGSFTTDNHLDLAVTQSGDPTGDWNIYSIDVHADGTNIGGVNPGPYLGDYPHIGADANGVYLTTNAYPWCCNGFGGAQVYALSKAQLAAGASNVTAVHFSTAGAVPVSSDAGSTQPGFTVWPAQSPNGQFNTANGGTEFFMSSNAADEATHPVAGFGGNYTSSQIIVWSLTNSSSLDSATPSVSLSNRVVQVNPYAIPPKAHQQGAGTAPGLNVPLGHCINDTTTSTIAGVGCWRLLFGSAPAHNEVISTPDSNDTRMQQVMYANGKLWGALDTALSFSQNTADNRAGIAYYILNPNSGAVAKQGYLGAAGYDFTYPAIGVNSSGRGIMAFTAMGDTMYPSAAAASIDAVVGAGAWSVVNGGQGAAPDDGFTSYKAEVGNPPRTRWGDYGAASVDGNSIWVASEYIAAPCDYNAWGGPYFGGTGDNLLGTCGSEESSNPGVWTGVRGALGNWSTRISQFKP